MFENVQCLYRSNILFKMNPDTLKPTTLLNLEACNFISNDLFPRYQPKSLVEAEFCNFINCDIP